MQRCIILNANKAVECGIFGRFSNLDKCQLEAAGDVISGKALDNVGTDDPAGFGDSRSNTGRIIFHSFPTGHVLRTFVQYLITCCSRPEEAGDIICSKFVGPVVLDKLVTFHALSLNRS